MLNRVRNQTCWFDVRVLNRSIYKIPMAALSKAYVCGRLLAGVAGSNPAEGMDVCCVYMLCYPV
jgi:hypothetical protein